MTQPDAGHAGAVSPMRRVLITDDSQGDADNLSLEIQRSMRDVQTRWAEGEEAMFVAISQWQPDIVLTDVRMPRFDIFSALRRIRAHWPWLPVVVVSGQVGDEMAASLIRAGANDFVSKSNASRLAAVIERELRDADDRAEKRVLQDRVRQQSALLEQVLEHLPVGVFLLDEVGTIGHVNPAGEAIWRGVPHEDVNGYRQYKGWWADSGRPLAPNDWAATRAILQGETVIEDKIEIESAGELRRTILNSAVPLFSDKGGLQGCLVVSQEITALLQTEKRLRRTERTLRALSQRLLEAQEQERRWIAQELHDDIGQGIAAMRLQLARIVESDSEDEASMVAAEALVASGRLGDRLRQICLGLRPLELDEFGLMAALRSMLGSLGSRPALQLGLRCDGEELRYPPALETAAFRIAQEALSNALRHSGCTALQVQVQMRPDSLTLCVHDDGCGFDPGTTAAGEARLRSLGLAGMEERALSAGGRFELRSQLGKGTEVRAIFESVLDVRPPGLDTAGDTMKVMP